MDDKKRIVLTAAIVCVVLLAVLSSFLPNIFSHQPDIIVADPNATPSPLPSDQAAPTQQVMVVEIGPNTVQGIIADLKRYDSYSRTMTVEYFDGEGASLGQSAVQVWVDGDWTRTAVTVPSGAVENAVLNGDAMWLWYNEGYPLYKGNAKRLSADLMQRIPTYEDVLSLAVENITAADYVERGGVPCVYVESVDPLLGYTERWWISEAGGLLMAAETVKDGAVVYSMTSDAVVSPLSAADGVFALPDGTDLRTAGA